MATERGRCGGTGVFEFSLVYHPGPGSFLAVQPCYPDWSQNGANVDFSLEKSDGALL